MKPQYGYFEDPLLLEFDALVVESFSLPEGRTGVILDWTSFYPTGGGQAHDTGTLNGIPVLDVFRQPETGAVVHVLDRGISTGPVHAVIDRERRLRHMQHHTGQHLLSACFERLFGLETLSSHISGYSPSTIDLPDRRLNGDDLRQVEDLAHEVIFQDLRVKAYFIGQDQLQTVMLRRPPKVSGEIRVVEIEDFDAVPCGGTHCLTTGMIGMVKILKTERQNQKTRIHFLAGLQALAYFQELHAGVVTMGELLNVGWRDLPAAVQRQAETLRLAQKELKSLRQGQLASEMEELLARAIRVETHRLVTAVFKQRPVDELQSMAKALMKTPDVVAVLGTLEGRKSAVVVSCGSEVTIHAGELLRHILKIINGRGGGGPRLAQGGGVATREQMERLLDEAQGYLQEVSHVKGGD